MYQDTHYASLPCPVFSSLPLSINETDVYEVLSLLDASYLLGLSNLKVNGK